MCYAIATLVSVVAMYLKPIVLIHQLRHRRDELELDDGNDKDESIRAGLIVTLCSLICFSLKVFQPIVLEM